MYRRRTIIKIRIIFALKLRKLQFGFLIVVFPVINPASVMLIICMILQGPGASGSYFSGERQICVCAAYVCMCTCMCDREIYML